MRLFRRDHIVTHMVAADDVAVALEDQPLLKNALANWQAGRVVRKLFCPVCKLSFADEDAKVGAFLFAVPVNIGALVATSAFCAQCWQNLSITEVERVATRVLQPLAPGGRFIDARSL
jgi:hypothetical protein